MGTGSEKVSEVRAPFWRRHPGLKWTAIVLLAVFAVLIAAVSVALHRAEPLLRAEIVSKLEQQFHSRVELDSFHMSLAGGLRAEGKGLRIWPPAEVNGVTVPAASSGKPLISLDDFRFRAPLHYSPDEPIHISVVQLKGLTVDMPPKSRFTHAKKEQTEGADKSKVRQALIRFDVGSIVCEDTNLILETDKPGKLPLEFEIAKLKLTDIQAGGTMKFNGDLTNARPVGTILTAGTFGPWSVEDPGESPITGEYSFKNANLGDFKGIAGTLNSTGKYTGTLRNLIVDGVTDTPNFQLSHFGSPLPLHTEFHARVDGTNGDTWLEPVNATLGQSHFTAQGEIVRVAQIGSQTGSQAGSNGGKPSPGVAEHEPDAKSGTGPLIKGHDISLKVNVPRGRMEDFMRLTSKSGTPLMTGWLTLTASIDIPPGKESVHQRIKLKGKFSLDDALFTSEAIESKIADLSLRGQGDPKQAKDPGGAGDIHSAMAGDFTMAGGVITLPNLTYTVPGAHIDLSGTYGVEGGALDFKGTAKMQATVSQMLGGWKGFLAKPIDGLFKKDGAGTEVPIHIDGTRDHPQFGIDFGRMKNHFGG
jgi:hypothetical protein